MEPDSSSSREAVLSFRSCFCVFRILNTEAASVDAITEPIRKLSSHSSPRTNLTNSPTKPAVSATPAVDRSTAFAATGLAAFRFVPKPP